MRLNTKIKAFWASLTTKGGFFIFEIVYKYIYSAQFIRLNFFCCDSGDNFLAMIFHCYLCSQHQRKYDCVVPHTDNAATDYKKLRKLIKKKYSISCNQFFNFVQKKSFFPFLFLFRFFVLVSKLKIYDSFGTEVVETNFYHFDGGTVTLFLFFSLKLLEVRFFFKLGTQWAH